MPITNYNTDAYTMASNKWLSKTATDNISKFDPALYKMKQNGMIAPATLYGGNFLLEPVMTSFNQTVQGLSSPTTTINPTLQDNFTNAEYAWSAYAGSTTFSHEELNVVSGEPAMLNLVKERTENTAKAFINLICTHLYDAQASGAPVKNHIMSLDYALCRGTVNTTVGGITRNATTNTWWHHKQVTGSTGTSTGGSPVDGIAYLIQQCTYDTRPDLVVTPINFWNVMHQHMRDDQRFIAQNQETADAGFQNLLVQGVEVAWSRFMTDSGGATSTTYGSAGNTYTANADGHFFVLTTKHMALRTQGGTLFQVRSTKWDGIPDQPGIAMVMVHYLECALTFASMRTQGRGYNWDHIP